MKRPVLFLLLSLLLCSCIDEGYDLSKIESDQIAIGNDQSEFFMPLTRLAIRVDRLIAESDEGEVNIMETYNEADIWLPSTLPNGAEYVEVIRLSEDETYLRAMLDGLFEEMLQSEQKRMEVCTLIASSYRDEFIALLSPSLPSEVLTPIRQTTTEEAAVLIADLFLHNEWQEEVIQSIMQLASSHICDMQIDDVIYEIPSLGLSHDVEQMLLSNLDPMETEPVINALYLYGTVECELPFQLQAEPYFEQTTIDFGTLHIGHALTYLDEVRIASEDMQVIFDGTALHMPVLIEHYYPHVGITPEQEIHINISLRKTGSLKF